MISYCGYIVRNNINNNNNNINLMIKKPRIPFQKQYTPLPAAVFSMHRYVLLPILYIRTSGNYSVVVVVVVVAAAAAAVEENVGKFLDLPIYHYDHHHHHCHDHYHHEYQARLISFGMMIVRCICIIIMPVAALFSSTPTTVDPPPLPPPSLQ